MFCLYFILTGQIVRHSAKVSKTFCLAVSLNDSAKTSIQSIKICIAPLQDPYSEALPTQTTPKRTVLRRWWNCEQAPFGSALDLLEVHSTLLDQSQKKNRSALQQLDILGLWIQLDIHGLCIFRLFVATPETRYVNPDFILFFQFVGNCDAMLPRNIIRSIGLYSLDSTLFYMGSFIIPWAILTGLF